MSGTHCLPPPSKDFAVAKRQYVEHFGSTLVMNTYLKIALLIVSLVALALVVLNIRTYQAFHNLKPRIIRINEVGRAEALRYETFDYQPQEAEIKYFLIDFIQRHYSRMRATVQENYSRSLYFLDGRLADTLIEANKKTNAIEAFLAGSGEEIDVKVKNVAIEDLRHQPYRATVDFEKIYCDPASRQETKRERYVANLVFVVREKVSNAMIPVNPLGLSITYFREDQAFQ
jgi:type IV secretion system protein VirB5